MMTTDETTKSKNVRSQSITQKDLDAMSEPKRKFFDERIKAGQITVVPEYTPETERVESRGPFTWLKGKTVRVFLPEGYYIDGTLTDVWQYEIALDVPDFGSVLLLKHAVLMVHELKGGKALLPHKSYRWNKRTFAREIVPIDGMTLTETWES